MSQVSKEIIRILMNRIRSKIRLEIEQGQSGFVKYNGRKTAIFMIRMLLKPVIHLQNDLYIHVS